jgi:ATP-dependent DNA helicase RecQ
MEQIVYSGTKLNIKYWIDEVDDEQQEEYMIILWSLNRTDKIRRSSKI